MTIRKGEEWGTRIVCPSDFVVAEDDFDASRQTPGDPFALRRGDVFSALGSPRMPRPNSECTMLPIDALKCVLTSANGEIREERGISSVTLGSWWRGSFVILSNSGFWNGVHIAPRSHPNDGEADLVSISPEMPFRQRFLARRRARTGTHLPHPMLSARRCSEFSHHKVSPRERLTIDGRAIDNWVSIEVSIIPDFWSVLV